MSGMRWSVECGGGTVPVVADEHDSNATVILAHGAGGDMEHRTILWLAGLLRQASARVVRFNFLYRALGRGMPDRMDVLMDTYLSVIDSVRARIEPERLIIGGHSMGGRVGSMVEARGRHADGLLLFAYPLHPANQPEKLRDAHLANIVTPTLQLSGTEDELCTRELMERVYARLDSSVWKLVWLEGASHSYAVKKSSGMTRKELEQEIVAEVRAWLAVVGA